MCFVSGLNLFIWLVGQAPHFLEIFPDAHHVLIFFFGRVFAIIILFDQESLLNARVETLSFLTLSFLRSFDLLLNTVFCILLLPLSTKKQRRQFCGRFQQTRLNVTLLKNVLLFCSCDCSSSQRNQSAKERDWQIDTLNKHPQKNDHDEAFDAHRCVILLVLLLVVQFCLGGARTRKRWGQNERERRVLAR